MKVLIVDRSGKIPATTYGGTERVIWGLGKALHALGHEVTFLVPGGSGGRFARILPLDVSKDLNEQVPDDIDVVHMNYRPDRPLHKPYLITMHGNPSPGDIIDLNTVFISRNQAQRYGSEVFVHNGLDWSDYPKPNLDHERTYLHFLGKVSWKVKNAFGAAKIAVMAGWPIKIMGGDRWTFRNINRGIRYLVNPKVHFKGMVDDREKITIMSRSKALIFPVEWHEPFGLAIIESLYAGCSVFGTTNGSLPELITPEVGVVSNASEGLVAAIHAFQYDPKKCHEHAVSTFNSEAMTKKYLDLYKKVLLGIPLHEVAPVYIFEKNTIQKLA
ncbi:glycosyltransferase [Altibacter lentus]|uniref:glycosyltransferase n=1 Tax=Altibacter lentus TaxID=1223410 RepID=UPI00054EF78C|nr:glycosyltransferase [Altibacter lentus]